MRYRRYHRPTELKDETDVELRRETFFSDLLDVLQEELLQAVLGQVLPGVDDPGGGVQELGQVGVVLQTVLGLQNIQDSPVFLF